MLCAMPPLQIPTTNSHAARPRRYTQTATNTLHITHPSRTFFTPSSLSNLKATIAPLAPSGILSFSPLKSLRRVIIVFASPNDALKVRTALDGQTRMTAPTYTHSNSLSVDMDGDLSMSSSESDCAEPETEKDAPIRCYYGETTIITEKKLLKVGERRKHEFDGENPPHEQEGEELKVVERRETFGRKRSESLILLQSDGRKPAIEVEEF